VCAGSVFKSWSLIKPGFLRCLMRYNSMNKQSRLDEINLVCVRDDSTVGAALLASKLCSGARVPFDLSTLTEPLDHLYIKQLQQRQVDELGRMINQHQQQQHHDHFQPHQQQQSIGADNGQLLVDKQDD
jgi:hypothetical protein